MLKDDEDSKINFESSLKELEKIVSYLENGELSLEDALNAFEKGIYLAQVSHKKLKQAEQRIQILLNSENNSELSSFIKPDKNPFDSE
ncbi:MAG: exodeoxyribonuclease VII small subunit [Candidatus Dasytiphilus stammeri]